MTPTDQNKLILDINKARPKENSHNVRIKNNVASPDDDNFSAIIICVIVSQTFDGMYREYNSVYAKECSVLVETSYIIVLIFNFAGIFTCIAPGVKY